MFSFSEELAAPCSGPDPPPSGPGRETGGHGHVTAAVGKAATAVSETLVRRRGGPTVDRFTTLSQA